MDRLVVAARANSSSILLVLAGGGAYTTSAEDEDEAEAEAEGFVPLSMSIVLAFSCARGSAVVVNLNRPDKIDTTVTIVANPTAIYY